MLHQTLKEALARVHGQTNKKYHRGTNNPWITTLAATVTEDRSLDYGKTLIGVPWVHGTVSRSPPKTGSRITIQIAVDCYIHGWGNL